MEGVFYVTESHNGKIRMDVETHDLLRGIAPSFGDVYLQENRPENMAYYNMVRRIFTALDQLN